MFIYYSKLDLINYDMYNLYNVKNVEIGFEEYENNLFFFLNVYNIYKSFYILYLMG